MKPPRGQALRSPWPEVASVLPRVRKVSMRLPGSPAYAFEENLRYYIYMCIYIYIYIYIYREREIERERDVAECCVVRVA